jgi:hypothetical protein
MIRRDYILRMIEEFVRALARISGLRQQGDWAQAAETMDQEFNRLVGGGAQGVAQLSETELLARLMQGEPTQVVRDKTLILTALLKEAGDLAAAQGRMEESRTYHLKALHLLLDLLDSSEVFDFPEFVPTMGALLIPLKDSPLPMRTQAVLMRHYERTREFAKAEDALFAMLEADPHNADLVQFGLAFYQRLLAQSDTALAIGGLPRDEVQQGLGELQGRLEKRL